MRVIKSLILLSVLLCLGLRLPAQQDWTWCIGGNVKILFSGSGAPNAIIGQSLLTHGECGASISDNMGNLLFYANHDSVLDAANHLMPNGRFSTNFNGFSVTQGMMVIPEIANPSSYLIFHLAWANILQQGGSLQDTIYLRQTKVDMSRNGGMGAVTLPKEVPMYRGHPLTEKMTAVRHANGQDWWLILHERDSNAFLVLLLNEQGLQAPTRQLIGSAHSSSFVFNSGYGEMCFSPDGTRLLVACAAGFIDLFDFDRCTGTLSNWISATTTPIDNYVGCSFSPDGSKYYVSSLDRFWHFDNSNVGTVLFNNTSFGANFCEHELGPDGRIYFSNQGPAPWADSLHAITNPNGSSSSCGFFGDAIDCGSRIGQHLPNFPNYKLSALMAQTAQIGPREVYLCPGDSLLLGYPDTTNGAVTFAWSGPGLVDTTLAQQTIHPTASGRYYLTVTDSGFGLPCGITQDSIHVIMADSNNAPVADAGLDTTVCPGNVVVLNTATNPNWMYQWSTGSDSSSTAVTQAGTYSLIVRQQGSSRSCWADTDFVAVDTFPLLPRSVNLAGPDQLHCPGDSVSLGGNTSMPYVFAWSVGAVPQDSLHANATGQGSFVLSTYNADSIGRCFLGADTVLVTEIDSSQMPNVALGNDTTICAMDSLVLSVIQGAQYLWSTGDTTVQVSVTGPGAYSVTVSDPSVNLACLMDADTILISEFQAPIVMPLGFAGHDSIICLGDSALLGTSGTVSGWDYLWSPSNSLSSATIAQPRATPTASQYYALVASDSASGGRCLSRTDTVYIMVEQPFAHVAPEDVSFCVGECFVIGVDAASGMQYAWTPTTGLTSPDMSMTRAQPTSTTIYNLSVVNPALQSANCRERDFTVMANAHACDPPSFIIENARGLIQVFGTPEGSWAGGAHQGRVSLQLVDVTGRVVYRNADYQNDLSTATLTSGLYYYGLTFVGECPVSFVGKLLVAR